MHRREVPGTTGRVVCPACGQASRPTIEGISDSSEPEPWSRVMMGCEHVYTLHAEDAGQIAAIAAGRLGAATFPDPDSDRYLVFVRARE